METILFLAVCFFGGLTAGAVLGVIAAVAKAGYDRLTK